MAPAALRQAGRSQGSPRLPGRQPGGRRKPTKARRAFDGAKNSRRRGEAKVRHACPAASQAAVVSQRRPAGHSCSARALIRFPHKHEASRGPGLPAPRRRTFSTGIVPSARCTPAALRHPGCAGRRARLPGHGQPLPDSRLRGARSSTRRSREWQSRSTRDLRIGELAKGAGQSALRAGGWCVIVPCQPGPNERSV